MSRSSESKTSISPPTEAHPWLHEKVYEPKRQRTAELTRQAIDSLLGKNQQISWASVVAESKVIDPEGKGVSETGIRGNPDAKAYFDEHSTWKRSNKRPLKHKAVAGAAPPVRSFDPTRDTVRVRQRLMRLEKKELVEQLLTLQQAYGEQERQWLTLNDQLLVWKLRAEVAEARLQQAVESADMRPRGAPVAESQRWDEGARHGEMALLEALQAALKRAQCAEQRERDIRSLLTAKRVVKMRDAIRRAQQRRGSSSPLTP